MRHTRPQVYLISAPNFLTGNAERYLRSIGADSWLAQVYNDPTTIPPDAELLVEFAGRMCYQSWKPGINPNVTRVRTDRKEYLQNILRSAHGSVLEHANFTFVFQNVSRVFTHELVRHRAGVAISQESLRYVRLADLGFRVPEVLSPIQDQVIELVEKLEEFQVSAAEHFGLDDEGVPFHYKKEVTSALRRLAPLGLSTTIVWTANLRTLRHVIEMRTAPGAEEEIRDVFHTVGVEMRRRCPYLFDDYVIEDGAWVSEFRKV